MENFNEPPKGVKVEKDGQTALNFDDVDNVEREKEKEKIEKEEIIKDYRIPKSQLNLLNKKGKEWFIGDKDIYTWLEEKRKEEHDDDLSYVYGRK